MRKMRGSDAKQAQASTHEPKYRQTAPSYAKQNQISANNKEAKSLYFKALHGEMDGFCFVWASLKQSELNPCEKRSASLGPFRRSIKQPTSTMARNSDLYKF